MEALKRERQKRIAARSGSSTSQSPSSPKLVKPRMISKPSPTPSEGSKFSDVDPQKATKFSILNGNNQGLTRSASSLSEIKKENNGLVSEAKVDSLRLKRLSEPKSSSFRHASSVKSATADQVPKRSVPGESRKKITEIMQLDKSKLAALPGLKIKTTTSSEKVANGITSNKKLDKGNGSKISHVSESIDRKSTNDKSLNNIDDNPVIEKTVVMLEHNVVTAPVVQQPDEVISTKERSDGDDLSTTYTAIRAPPSPIVICQVEHSNESKVDEQKSSNEVYCIKEKLQNF